MKMATKESPKKRRSRRLSQTEESANGTDNTGDISSSEDVVLSTPLKRSRTNSLRSSAKKLKESAALNGISELANDTIIEEDENTEKATLIESSAKKTNGLMNGDIHETEIVSQKIGNENKFDEIKNQKVCQLSKSQKNGTIKNQEETIKEKIISLPKADTLSNVLAQALQSNDLPSISHVLSHEQNNLMENTLRALPNEFVENLFKTLCRFLHKNGTNPLYINWMRKLIQCKISHIVNVPEIKTQLMLLSDTLDIKTDLLDRCYKLKGRLELMLSLAETERKACQKENIILYEESSSESENEVNDNEDDNDENVMKIIQSDDEPINGHVDDLDEGLSDLEDALYED